MIKGFNPRLYQETIFSTCSINNTLVVLPTGLGKTNIFLMLAAQRIHQHPNSKVLFIGPTRPLISQYKTVFERHFDIDNDKLAVFTGHVSPKKRAELWRQAQIIFSTPQGLENDIISRRISLKDVSLLGVDEAHRAVGEYAYVWIAKEYDRQAAYPRIIALTASPGSDKEKITEVCNNLFIEDIEVRTQEDPDVKPYVQEIRLTFKEVSLPPLFIEVKSYLEECYRSKLKNLKELGHVSSINIRTMSKRDLLSIQGQLVAEMNSGNRDFETLKSISLVAEAMKISHGIELLESQGVHALHTYLSKLMREARSSKVKAVKNLVSDVNFKSGFIKVERLVEEGIEHPKFAMLGAIIRRTLKKQSAKVIIFTQYRDTAVKIAETLEKIEGVSPRIFVGQQKKGNTGLSQKKQIEMLDDFRENAFNTIIMTSVGEEGLDIPKVDQVIFFEPVPSVIRHIQRRGRTGRQEKGDVIVLVAKGTRDEVYRWSTKHKEARMYRSIRDIKHGVKLQKREQKELPIFERDEIEVYTDYREKGSGVIKELLRMNVHIHLDRLEIADYVISKRVGIEYKRTDDFVNSIVDGRLLSQLKDLKNNFQRPLVIVEGDRDIYSVRNIHPNAIKGMIATITVSYGIPIIYTKNAKESAEFIQTVARREQDEIGKGFNVHGEKKPLSPKEQQEYIVSSLPHIGPSLAKDLLAYFGTVKAIVNADHAALKEVDKVGDVIADDIRNALDNDYTDYTGQSKKCRKRDTDKK